MRGPAALAGDWHGRPVVLAPVGHWQGGRRHHGHGSGERFGVARIVFTGVAGGGRWVQVGDVVVAHDYVQHDMDASPCSRAGAARLRKRTRLGCDTALTAMLLEAASAYVQTLQAIRLKLVAGQPCAHRLGSLPVATALSAPRRKCRDLRSRAQPARRARGAGGRDGRRRRGPGLPRLRLPFAAMRTISDRADDSPMGLPGVCEHRGHPVRRAHHPGASCKSYEIHSCWRLFCKRWRPF